MSSLPETPPQFPISYSLGYRSPFKTKIRPLVEKRITTLLDATNNVLKENVNYPPEAKIRPHIFGEHRLTRPHINPGHANPHHLGQPFQWCSPKLHPNCTQRYHAIDIDDQDSAQELVRRVPELGVLLHALREVAPTPRATRSRPRAINSPSPARPSGWTKHGEDFHVFSPTGFTPFLGEFHGFLGKNGSLSLDGLGWFKALSWAWFESVAYALSNGSTPEEIHPELNMQRAVKHILNLAPSPPRVPQLNFSIMLGQGERRYNYLPFKPSVLISEQFPTSSQTGDETLELAYPADPPPIGQIMDMTKPMHLVVWFDNLNEPARLTVYPRCREDEDEIMHLHLHDYSILLSSIGFNTSTPGYLYLTVDPQWIQYDCSIPLPLARANTLIYIRSAGVSVGSPDEVLDTLF
ncbi:hypothetical protein B0H17DRAFT_1149392 [Mycena rosella]|uniref:Uncharacterized protein n=1 Tax=Mycena rosella TaxID=1033263 RepID=A0AAD7FT33_MYCRO|nr:hypothetical protein B0H17DRAFT_1149392 [Mycena rosella]